MAFSETESGILNRFHEKCRIAGGAKAGYNLRRQAVEAGLAGLEGDAVGEGLASLVEKGLLISNEAGDHFILTATGVEVIESDFA